MAVTDPHPSDDEKAPPQIEPDKPDRARDPKRGMPPSDQPRGRPQHEAADPDDDS
jgi:hypothetical protein